MRTSLFPMALRFVIYQHTEALAHCQRGGLHGGGRGGEFPLFTETSPFFFHFSKEDAR